MEITPTSANVMEYAAIVRDKALLRGVAQAAAERHGVPFQAVRLESGEQARENPSPFTAYSLFWQGEFVTHEIQSEKKIEKLLEALS